MDATGKFKVIGIMSGTSLDGVDITACEFWINDNNWHYKIVKGKTYRYDETILKRLKVAQNLSGLELSQLDVDYGKYLGKLVRNFIQTTSFKSDFIASHGYTVFHEPGKGLTLQIGSGAHLAAVSGVKTICNFRTTDVALGGQGAPLVPIGDELLFSEYVACLNLGGFSNISFREKNMRIAFDICPVNYVLNFYTQKLGKPYDENGWYGQQGQVNSELLLQLNKLDYYQQQPPKSLGREFVEACIFPIISEAIKVEDVLATLYEHIAIQLSTIITTLNIGNVLVTGGGAFNEYLIELLKLKTNHSIVVPNKELIDFKEALIFGFLGVLRELELPNCLASVTGASKDNVGGSVFLP